MTICKVCNNEIRTDNLLDHVECYVDELNLDRTFQMRREELGLSIEEVAKRTGMSIEEIKEIEKHS